MLYWFGGVYGGGFSALAKLAVFWDLRKTRKYKNKWGTLKLARARHFIYFYSPFFFLDSLSHFVCSLYSLWFFFIYIYYACVYLILYSESEMTIRFILFSIIYIYNKILIKTADIEMYRITALQVQLLITPCNPVKTRALSWESLIGYQVYSYICVLNINEIIS